MHAMSSLPEGGSFWKRYQEVIRLAAPASVSMLSYTMVGVVDTLCMGRIGAEEVAGVGMANTLVFTFASLIVGMVGAVEALAAQHEGAGNRPRAGLLLHQATWLALAGGVLIGLPLALWAFPLMSLMNPGEAVARSGATYLSIRALGLPLFFLTASRDHFLQGLGDTRTPMRVALLINLVHVVLNVWFIFGGLGIPALHEGGAALSTVVSHLLSLVIYRHVLRLRHQAQPAYQLVPLARPNRAVLSEIVRMGLPMGVQFMLDIGSWLVLTTFVGWIGPVALAANQITLRVVSVTFMTVHGVAIATTSLVGRCLGAGRVDLARQYGFTAITVGLSVMGSIGLTYLVVPQLWLGMFTRDQAVLDVARTLLQVGLVFQVFDCVAMVSFGALKGAGDTRFTLWMTALAAWGVALPLGYWLAFPMGFGAVGVYWAITAQMVIVSVANVWRFYGNRWLQHTTEHTGILLGAPATSQG